MDTVHRRGVLAVALAAVACVAGIAAAQSPSPETAFGLRSGDYRLGPADRVRVTVFGEDNLSGEFLLANDGSIAMPLIGEVPALGRTAEEVRKDIEARLGAGYLNEPRVSVEVLDYRPFYILGEVNKAGEYPYKPGLTVLGAVATAEGFTYRANTHRVYIKHASDPKEHEYPITSDLAVAPGDVIRVGERFF